MSWRAAIAWIGIPSAAVAILGFVVPPASRDLTLCVAALLIAIAVLAIVVALVALLFKERGRTVARTLAIHGACALLAVPAACVIGNSVVLGRERRMWNVAQDVANRLRELRDTSSRSPSDIDFASTVDACIGFGDGWIRRRLWFERWEETNHFGISVPALTRDSEVWFFTSASGWRFYPARFLDE